MRKPIRGMQSTRDVNQQEHKNHIQLKKDKTDLILECSAKELCNLIKLMQFFVKNEKGEGKHETSF